MTDERPTARPFPTGTGGPTADSGRKRPERPALDNPNAAPVIVKQPPPFSIRVTQLLWVLGLVAGSVAVVYYFVVREDQLPLIIEAVRGVDGSRQDSTYATAADIIYWSAFWGLVALLLIQITLLVSFMNRKDGARWWMFFTVLGQAALYLVANELVAEGEHGEILRQMFAVQGGLVLLAILVSTFPGALRWTARKHDVRKGVIASPGSEV
ncbi:hypothetical protein H5398_12935 [Tessaracoccus sp. MC1679]|uniref:hypothetical protein n=1 Tax=unclassified Tessaracoccus TaxID=2635419 RepID=UPI001602FF78|nr:MULTISPECIES: hypothetical protein [unclassified Tessaracoccus]MBB1511195.1 hypothetical protein [Tessaracoccus sp. MC1627]MBB1516868.1 hypothetical protein [Tessaracoccus sp. MC1679]